MNFNNIGDLNIKNKAIQTLKDNMGIFLYIIIRKSQRQTKLKKENKKQKKQLWYKSEIKSKHP